MSEHEDMDAFVDDWIDSLTKQREMRIVSAHKITDQQYALHVGPLGNGRVWMRVIDDYFEFDKDQVERLVSLLGSYLGWKESK